MTAKISPLCAPPLMLDSTWTGRPYALLESCSFNTAWRACRAAEFCACAENAAHSRRARRTRIPYLPQQESIRRPVALRSNVVRNPGFLEWPALTQSKGGLDACTDRSFHCLSRFGLREHGREDRCLAPGSLRARRMGHGGRTRRLRGQRHAGGALRGDLRRHVPGRAVQGRAAERFGAKTEAGRMS